MQRYNLAVPKIVQSKLADFDSLMGVESCPLDSHILPRRNSLLKAFAEERLLRVYHDAMCEFLKPQPVGIVSAVSSNGSLGPDVRPSPWFDRQAQLAGQRPDQAEFVPFLTKGTTTAAAALVAMVNSALRALVLMTGGSHLPAKSGLRLLASKRRRPNTR